MHPILCLQLETCVRTLVSHNGSETAVRVENVGEDSNVNLTIVDSGVVEPTGKSRRIPKVGLDTDTEL